MYVCVSRLMWGGGASHQGYSSPKTVFILYFFFRLIRKGLFYITIKSSTQLLESMAHELSAVCVVDFVFHTR